MMKSNPRAELEKGKCSGEVERTGEALMTHKPPEHNGRPLPPINSRFKPGSSGNPAGRPPSLLCLASLLKAQMMEPCPLDKQGRTWAVVIVSKTLEQAYHGDASALRMVWERVDGRVKQSIEDIETAKGPVALQVIYYDAEVKNDLNSNKPSEKKEN